MSLRDLRELTLERDIFVHGTKKMEAGNEVADLVIQKHFVRMTRLRLARIFWNLLAKSRAPEQLLFELAKWRNALEEEKDAELGEHLD